MKKIVNSVRGYFAAHESNLDKFKSQDELKESAYLEKFNNQIANKVALVFNITDKVALSSAISDEDKNNMREAFDILKKAIHTLEVGIITTDFFALHISSSEYTALSKDRLLEVVSICKQILARFHKYWMAQWELDQDDLMTLESNINRIERELNR